MTPDADATELFHHLTDTALEQGALIGLVTMDNVGEFLMIQAAERGTLDAGARSEDPRNHA